MKKLILITFVLLMVSCKASKDTGINEANPLISEARAPVLIYKTRLDHFNHVPIALNSTRDKVSSYPAPADLLSGGEFLRPVKLKKGFLLDRRGINVNTVFTSYSYEEYSQLESAPSLEELLDRVVDTDPFVSIYDCGKRGSYTEVVKELNTKIKKGMEGCKELKLP